MKVLLLLLSCLLAVTTLQHAYAQPGQGAILQVWTCQPNSVNQQWLLPNSNHLILLNANQNLCLDIQQYGTTNGSTIWLYAPHINDKDPTHQNQEWTYHSNQTITSDLSGLCLEAHGVEDGSPVQIWSCSGSAAQKWTYNPTDKTLRVGSTGLCLDAGTIGTCQSQPWSSYPYCDYNLDPLTRTKDLISRMTLPEKVTMTMSDTGGVPRLAVPPFGHTECTHGTLNDGTQTFATTLFPQALTVARTFNRPLLNKIGASIADEVRAKSNTAAALGQSRVYPFGLVCWAPVVNVCRDPRWGRCQEGYGEDPYLQGELSFEYVTALQNMAATNHKYIQASATCKHFDVHSGPEDKPSSRFSFDANVNYRDWIDTYQPAFKRCGEAGAVSYMCSYNSINGIPACANRELLDDLLRNTWNFTGFVVSDCDAVYNIYHDHNFGTSDVEAATLALTAGTDWNCGNEFAFLQPAVEGGYLSEAVLDKSLTRVIINMFQLGLFDPPAMVPWSNLNLSIVAEHAPIALQAARESIVLLENRANLLPLDLSQYHSIAVIGPCGNDTDCPRGDYDPEPRYIITPAQAFQQAGLKVNYLSGCDDINCANDSAFAQAVVAAEESDIIVFVGGINKYVEAEGNDRINITLPGYQELLIQFLHNVSVAQNKPFIVLLNHGAVLSAEWTVTNVDTIVSIGYAGQEMGRAVVDVITGAYNPSGRLVDTWYKSIDQLGLMIDYDMMGGPSGRTYRYFTDDPLYHFGYGLSYTSFEYSQVTVSSNISICEPLEVSVTVTNTGSVSGDHSVLLFMSWPDPSTYGITAHPPHYQLVNFNKVMNLSPNESATISMSVINTQRAVVDEYNNIQKLVPGEFTLYIGALPEFAQASHLIDTQRQQPVVQTFQVSGSVQPVNAC